MKMFVAIHELWKYFFAIHKLWIRKVCLQDMNYENMKMSIETQELWKSLKYLFAIQELWKYFVCNTWIMKI